MTDIEIIFKKRFGIAETEPFPQTQGDKNIIDYFTEGFKACQEQAPRIDSIDWDKAESEFRRYRMSLDGVQTVSAYTYWLKTHFENYLKTLK